MQKGYFLTKKSSEISVKKVEEHEHVLNLKKHREQIKEAAENCFKQAKIQKNLTSQEHFREQGIGMLIAYNLLVKKLNADSDLYLFANRVEEEARS